MNTPFEWAPLFKDDKFNERPGLNECPPQTRKRAPIWKYGMYTEAFIKIVCKYNEARVFFSQIFFVFNKKEIYKHILQWFLNKEDSILCFIFYLYLFYVLCFIFYFGKWCVNKYLLCIFSMTAPALNQIITVVRNNMCILF